MDNGGGRWFGCGWGAEESAGGLGDRWFGCGWGAEQGPGCLGDAGDVSGGDLLEVTARSCCLGGVTASQPFAELGRRANADTRVRAIQAGSQRFGQGRAGDDWSD